MSESPSRNDLPQDQAEAISLVGSSREILATDVVVEEGRPGRQIAARQLAFGSDLPLCHYHNQPLVLPGRGPLHSVGRVRVQHSSIAGALKGRTLAHCACPYDDGLELCTFRLGVGSELRRQLLRRAAEMPDPARFLQQQEYNALEPEGAIGALLVGPKEEFPEIFGKRTRRLLYREPRTRWAVLPRLTEGGGAQDLEACLALLDQDGAIAEVAEQALQGWLYAPWLSHARSSQAWRLLLPPTVACSEKLLRFALQRALCGPRSAAVLGSSRLVKWLAIRICKEQLANENKHHAYESSTARLTTEANRPGEVGATGNKQSSQLRSRRELSESLWEGMNQLLAEHGPEGTLPKAHMLLADHADIEHVRCGLLLVGCLHHCQAIAPGHPLFREVEHLVQDSRVSYELSEELRLVAREVSEDKRRTWASLLV